MSPLISRFDNSTICSLTISKSIRKFLSFASTFLAGLLPPNIFPVSWFRTLIFFVNTFSLQLCSRNSSGSATHPPAWSLASPGGKIHRIVLTSLFQQFNSLISYRQKKILRRYFGKDLCQAGIRGKPKNLCFHQIIDLVDQEDNSPLLRSELNDLVDLGQE